MQVTRFVYIIPDTAFCLRFFCDINVLVCLLLSFFFILRSIWHYERRLRNLFYDLDILYRNLGINVMADTHRQFDDHESRAAFFIEQAFKS